MFERLLRLFKKSETAAVPQKPPVKREAVLPKKVSFNKPVSFKDGIQPAERQKAELEPQALLLPPAEPEPAPASKPVVERNTERNISMPLPPSISGEEVAMVQHAVKKTSGERFTYVDRTYRPSVKQEPPKKTNDIIKYNIKPLKMPSDHAEATRSDAVYAGKTQN